MCELIGKAIFVGGTSSKFLCWVLLALSRRKWKSKYRYISWIEPSTKKQDNGKLLCWSEKWTLTCCVSAGHANIPATVQSSPIWSFSDRTSLGAILGPMITGSENVEIFHFPCKHFYDRNAADLFSILKYTGKNFNFIISLFISSIFLAKRIPSEMEVASSYTLLTLLTRTACTA